MGPTMNTMITRIAVTAATLVVALGLAAPAGATPADPPGPYSWHANPPAANHAPCKDRDKDGRAPRWPHCTIEYAVPSAPTS